MIRHRIGGVEVAVSFWFLAAIALFAVAERGALMLYMLLPIAVHELGHLLVMAALRVRVKAVRCTLLGIDIRRETGHTLSYPAEIAVTLGGVAANALLALSVHLLLFQSMRMRFLVAANIAVAIFNLLPIGDLDGGQLIKLLGARFLPPDVARGVSKIAGLLVLAVLFGFGIFLAWIRYPNPLIFVAGAYLAGNVIARE